VQISARFGERAYDFIRPLLQLFRIGLLFLQQKRSYFFIFMQQGFQQVCRLQIRIILSQGGLLRSLYYFLRFNGKFFLIHITRVFADEHAKSLPNPILQEISADFDFGIIHFLSTFEKNKPAQHLTICRLCSHLYAFLSTKYALNMHSP
jgi:hypothetical protein